MVCDNVTTYYLEQLKTDICSVFSTNKRAKYGKNEVEQSELF